MTPFRQKFIEDMQLRGLADKTQTAYLNAVRDLAAHFRKSPDEITETELREYFVFLTNEKKVSYSAFRVSLCGIKLFYEFTVQRQWTIFDLGSNAKSGQSARCHRAHSTITSQSLQP